MVSNICDVWSNCQIATKGQIAFGGEIKGIDLETKQFKKCIDYVKKNKRSCLVRKNGKLNEN